MEKDTNIIIRVNSSLKERVTNIAKNRGVNLSEVINASLMDIDKRGMIPLNIQRFLPSRYGSKGTLTISFIKKCLNEILSKEENKKVRKVYLFGSYSRGEETFLSDVDLRLENDDGFSLFDLSNIRLDLKEALKKEVDIVTEKPEKLDTVFYNNIKKDEICLYER